MNGMFSAEKLAEAVNQWCDRNGVSPANGQAGERLTVRSIRYYRTLGLLDPPALGGGEGFNEKHRLQLIAVRLLQGQGLPLSRIQQLLFGRMLADLQRIEKEGLAELKQNRSGSFQPLSNESWRVTPLNDEFMLVSRRGRGLAPDLCQRLLTILEPKEENQGRAEARLFRNKERE